MSEFTKENLINLVSLNHLIYKFEKIKAVLIWFCNSISDYQKILMFLSFMFLIQKRIRIQKLYISMWNVTAMTVHDRFPVTKY